MQPGPDLKVVTRLCAAKHRHGGKVIGKGDVDLTSRYLTKHAEIAYSAP